MFTPNPSLGMNDPRLLPMLLAAKMSAGATPGPTFNPPPTPGFRAPALPAVPSMQGGQPPAQQPSIGQGVAGLGSALSSLAALNPGMRAQVAANHAEPAVQANPSTSAAGMAAGTNPDVGIGGGMQAPPDGGTGVGQAAAALPSTNIPPPPPGMDPAMWTALYQQARGR